MYEKKTVIIKNSKQLTTPHYTDTAISLFVLQTIIRLAFMNKTTEYCTYIMYN